MNPHPSIGKEGFYERAQKAFAEPGSEKGHIQSSAAVSKPLRR
jgi:hypothetical protein